MSSDKKITHASDFDLFNNVIPDLTRIFENVACYDDDVYGWYNHLDEMVETHQRYVETLENSVIDNRRGSGFCAHICARLPEFCNILSGDNIYCEKHYLLHKCANCDNVRDDRGLHHDPALCDPCVLKRRDATAKAMRVMAAAQKK